MTTIGDGWRPAARSLARNRGFSLLAGATIALGVGASTVIFSLVYGVLWRPIPYPNARRIVSIRAAASGTNTSLSYPDFADFRAQSRTLEQAAARTTRFVVMTGRGEPERIVQELVSADWFPLLGLRPVLGRDFTPRDDAPGAEPVVIVSRAFWDRELGADHAALGKRVTLDGQQYQVVGVMPDRVPSYESDPPQAWSPIGPWAAVHRDDYAARAHRPGITALGLARPGISVGSVRTELSLIARRLERQYPESNRGVGVRAERLSDAVVRSTRPALVALLGAVAVLLAIVCADLAGLMIARAASRRREIAIRAAMGASRSRIVRTLLQESALLGLAGGSAGAIAAWGALRWLAAHGPAALPRVAELGVDGVVLGFAAFVTMATVVAAGVQPAFSVSRGNLREVLAAGASTLSAATERRRAALIGAEVALSFVLVAGAGLLSRSFGRVLRVDPGLDPRNVLSAQLTLSDSRYRAAGARLTFYRKLLEELRATPGVEAAGITHPLPFTGKGMQLDFAIEGRPVPPPAETPSADSTVIDPGLVAALRIPLKSGRPFTDSDDARAPRVALVNSTLARRYWPGADPLGARFSTEEPGKRTEASWITIVGVVGDVRQYGLDREPNPQVYLAAAQMPLRTTTLVVRSRSDPRDLARVVRSVVRGIDPEQPVDGVKTMEDLLGESYAARRWAMLVLSFFALSAAVLAAVGLYGVVGYAVVRRTREIGLRIALGARGGDVVRLVLRDSGTAVAAGIGAGAVVALFATRFLRGFLFDVAPLDVPAFAAAALALVAAALAASVVPLRKACRIDPQTALRSD